MTDCPNCRRFREERDEAVEALALMRDAEADQQYWERVRRAADLFKIEPMPARMLLHLLNGRPARRDALAEVAGSASARSNNVDVRLSRLRAALRRHDIELHNRHSLGWAINKSDCEKILAMLEGAN